MSLKKKKNEITWSFSFRAEHFSPQAAFPRFFSVPVSEGAIQRYSRKKMFLKTSQNLQKNTNVKVSFLNKVSGLRLPQNIGLLKQTNFLTDIQKTKHKFVNKYSATKRAHLYCKWASFKSSILSSHFIILLNVALPRHSSISFSNVNLQPGLALIIDYMIIFKFHVYMGLNFQLGLFKSWLNFYSVYHDELFEYNHDSVFTLFSLTMQDEISSWFNELKFHPRLKISI